MSCPDCFSGSVHEGEPKGKMTEVFGLPTYEINPPEGTASKGIIVIIPDAFGIDFVNNKILADHYAEKGNYKVYLPDFMQGRSAPLSVLEGLKLFEKPGNYFAKVTTVPGMVASIVPWLWTNHPSWSYARVKSFFESLRKQEGPSVSVFAAGFCWGGKHVVRLATEDDNGSLMTAAFTAHPSLLKIPDEIEPIHVPVSFACPDHDPQVPLEKAKEIKQIVEAKPEGQTGEVTIYEGAGHGFSVRADVSFPANAERAAQAEDQCLAWFDKHLKA